MSRFITLIVISLIWGACSNDTAKEESATSRQERPVLKISGSKSSQEIGLQFLSEYKFFKGELAELKAAEGVLPYELNSPLFSDYAFKARFVKIPEGKQASYNAHEVLDFPIETVLIKNFYYPADFSQPKEERQIIETRLLIHEESGWKTLPYVWNAEQTDAELTIAGATKSVSWTDESGNRRQLDYSVPNMNQCRSCHLYNDQIKPIGPSARQLNKQYSYGGVEENQLIKWTQAGYLKELPSLQEVPKLVDYREASNDLGLRARAYLEINCGHCHRKEGPAKNSALELLTSIDNPVAWGIGKTPIAAGKGSGGLKYDIVPGKPHQSILWYRMNSVDPGVMMPEVGRKMIHTEGVDLVREWIEQL